NGNIDAGAAHLAGSGPCHGRWGGRKVSDRPACHVMTRLDKFDEWKEYGGRYPWYWGFEEIKEKRYGGIRTPKQFLRTLTACVQFFAEELKKDPNYRPPETFTKLMVRIRPMLDSIRPIVQARLEELKARR
ncbi:MAG TPA: hypothetical protein VI756_21595, partial [Blastocatellia bacterium]